MQSSRKPFGPGSLRKEWLDQAARQLSAAGNRELTWCFAEPEAAEFARKTFGAADDRRKIHISVLEWSETKQ